MELPFGGTFAKDTFETGTRAAAFGGTTSIVDFAVQSKGQALRTGLDAWHAKAEGNAVIDYGFHMIMSDVNDDTLAEMDQLVAEGVPDFKLFTAYPGVFYSPDDHIFRAMQQTRKNGGMILMHAENGPVIDIVAAQLVAEGKTDPYYHGDRALPACSRARRRAASSAWPRPRASRCTSSTSRSIDALNQVRAARDRGVMACAETCPQYMFLSLDDLGNGFNGAKFVCSPPLREKNPNWDELWNGLKRDDLQVVSTDHCPFDFHGQKELGRGDFRKIPNGLPGVEDRVDLVLQRRRRRRADQQGAVGGDRVHLARQALRHVPEEGRRSPSAPTRTSWSTTRTASARSAPRRTTWTSTTAATRAGRSRAAPTSS